jgi:hypothetical protein
MIALYKGKSFISRLIRWFTWSVYSHAAWVCRDGSVIEAWSGGVRHAASLGAAHDAGTPVDLFELDLTEDQLQAVEEFLLAQVGMKYDWLGLCGFLSRHAMDEHDAWFCSELVTAGLNAAGVYPLLRVPACKVPPCLLALSPLLRLCQSTVTGITEQARP